MMGERQAGVINSTELRLAGFEMAPTGVLPQVDLSTHLAYFCLHPPFLWVMLDLEKFFLSS
jgi:hypothetical protein